MHAKLTGAGLVLAAVAAGGLVVDHAVTAQAETQERKAYSAWHAAGSLPRNAVSMGYDLVRSLGRGDYTRFCFLFDDAGRAAFARARGVADCAEAARDLGAEIKPAYRIQYQEYIRLGWSMVTHSRDGRSATLDACRLVWQTPFINAKPMPEDGRPGPMIGDLALVHVDGLHGGGFRVTGYRPCSPGSAGPSSSAGPTPGTHPSSPSTSAPSTSAPRLLPSYAAGYPGVLARRWADGHHGCGFFSPSGARAFAKAWGAADCERAAAVVRGRIRDQDRYRRPLGARVTDGPRGRVVDGCALRWPTLDRSAPAPGPQVGRLTLERPEGSAGYWITDYRRC